METLVRVDREWAWNGEGQAYRVPRAESRVEVRMENRKVIDTKQGSGKRKWNKGVQGLEFWYRVAQSVTVNVVVILSNQTTHLLKAQL